VNIQSATHLVHDLHGSTFLSARRAGTACYRISYACKPLASWDSTKASRLQQFRVPLVPGADSVSGSKHQSLNALCSTRFHSLPTASPIFMLQGDAGGVMLTPW
jgi:hypothetical protein